MAEQDKCTKKMLKTSQDSLTWCLFQADKKGGDCHTQSRHDSELYQKYWQLCSSIGPLGMLFKVYIWCQGASHLEYDLHCGDYCPFEIRQALGWLGWPVTLAYKVEGAVPCPPCIAWSVADSAIPPLLGGIDWTVAELPGETPGWVAPDYVPAEPVDLLDLLNGTGMWHQRHYSWKPSAKSSSPIL